MPLWIRSHLLVFVLGGVAAIAALIWWPVAPEPTPRAIVATRDSLAATQPAFDSAQRADSAATAASQAEQRRLEQREHALAVRAAQLKAQADSLARIASEIQLEDSLDSDWRLAYDARTAEAATLRLQLNTSYARIDSLVADSVRAHDQLARERGRRLAAEGLNAKYETALSHALHRRLFDRLSGCAGYGWGLDPDHRITRSAFVGACVRIFP